MEKFNPETFWNEVQILAKHDKQPNKMHPENLFELINYLCDRLENTKFAFCLFKLAASGIKSHHMPENIKDMSPIEKLNFLVPWYHSQSQSQNKEPHPKFMEHLQYIKSLDNIVSLPASRNNLWKINHELRFLKDVRRFTASELAKVSFMTDITFKISGGHLYVDGVDVGRR